MGKSDGILNPWYKQSIVPQGRTALLGFQNNNVFPGDLYDLEIGNWDINDDWSLDGTYDTIISLRCPYFARDPQQFIEKCYEHLNDNGTLYVDWGLGDHWRFENYKIGWIKDGEQEYAYKDDNFLWSTVWDDSFLENEQYKIFCDRVKKFGYHDVHTAILQEVPNVLELKSINKNFDILYSIKTLWEDLPQLYVLVVAKKRKE
jgi:SAM-dependent methyltransferase